MSIEVKCEACGASVEVAALEEGPPIKVSRHDLFAAAVLLGMLAGSNGQLPNLRMCAENALNVASIIIAMGE